MFCIRKSLRISQAFLHIRKSHYPVRLAKILSR
ncbi:Uncharacterised protein [Vibrio cholerae]|nr:Uncharacterised protein [Vibrio cholerae]